VAETPVSYRSLADALGISVEAARAKIRRLKPRRTVGNKGEALFWVDLDAMKAREAERAASAAAGDEDGPAILVTTPAGQSGDHPGDRLDGQDGRPEPHPLAVQVDELRDRVLDLTAEVAALRATATAMEAALAVECERRADVEADRDRWHALATAHRPWWRRLVG
jgi:hypothetical protein